jgi:hypothetical protein
MVGGTPTRAVDVSPGARPWGRDSGGADLGALAQVISRCSTRAQVPGAWPWLVNVP